MQTKLSHQQLYYPAHSPDRYRNQSPFGQTIQQAPSAGYLYKDRSRTPNQPRNYGGNPLTIHNVSQSPSALHSPNQQYQNISNRKRPLGDNKEAGLLSWRNSQVEEQNVSYSPYQNIKLPQRTLDKSPKSLHVPYQKELSLLHLSSKASQNQSNISTNKPSFDYQQNNSSTNNRDQQVYAQLMSLNSEKQKLLDEQRQYHNTIDTLQKNNFQLLQIINSCSRCHQIHREKFEQLQQGLSRKPEGMNFKEQFTQDNLYEDIVLQLDQTNSHHQKVIKELQAQIKGMSDIFSQQSSDTNQKLLYRIREKDNTLKDLVQFTDTVLESTLKHDRESRHFKAHITDLEADLKVGSRVKDAQLKTRPLPAVLKAIHLTNI